MATMKKFTVLFTFLSVLILTSCGQENTEAKLEAAKSHYDRGCDYFEKGEGDEALSEFNKAIEINPRYAEAYYKRGHTYSMQAAIYGGKSIKDGDKGLEDQALAKLTRAIADFTKAIEINPRYVEAYLKRTIAYMLNGQADLAISGYTKLIEIDPENASDHYAMRGGLYNAKGQYNKAISDCNKAIEINPTNAHAYGFKSIACQKAGRIIEANEAWEKFMRYKKESDR